MSTCACGRRILTRTAYMALPADQRAGLSFRAGGTCRPCYKKAQRALKPKPPRQLGLRRAPKGWRQRSERLEDIVDVIEQEPTTTLAGLGIRLGTTTDALTLVLRRAARDGDRRAIEIRQRFNAELRKDIAS